VATDPPADLTLAPINGGPRTIAEWVTTFQLAAVVLDPSAHVVGLADSKLVPPDEREVLAMLITVAGVNAAMSRTLNQVIERQAGGSLQVIAPGAFEPDVGSRLLDLDTVAAVTPVTFGQTDRLTDEGSQRVDVTVIDPSTYFDVAGFAWVDGDDESAAAALSEGGAVLLPDATAAGAGADRGDLVELRTSTGVAEFIVAGTYAVVGPGFGVVAGTPDAESFGALMRFAAPPARISAGSTSLFGERR